MTVCLITPPSPFLMDERVFMTLGILRVAACLEVAGHKVEMLDLSGIENFLDAAREHAEKSSAVIFGITATTPQMPAAYALATAIRAIRPSVRLILGGPHVTLVQAALKRERKIGANGRATRAFDKLLALFDVLVCGDGEEAIFLAIQDSPPKVIDADDPASPLFLTNSRLNELPFPARHLVDVESYHYTIDGVRALSMIAQLGCPFACGFCGGRESPMLRRIRTRSTQNIIEEIKIIRDTYGARGVMLYDDELNVNPKMLELMKAIADLKSDLKLRGFIKSQLFTDAQAAAMHEAGFRWILVGFESGSPVILENINKKATREENTRCMEIAHRHGLKVKALMSIGHPGESEATIMDTHEWLMQVRPDDFDCTVITTYPGTPYYDQAVQIFDQDNFWTYTVQKTKDRLHAYEIDYTEKAGYYKGIPGEYVSYVFTDHLRSEQIVQLRDFVEKDVREKLSIPFNSGSVAIRYEHSMGMGLPQNILRKSL